MFDSIKSHAAAHLWATHSETRSRVFLFSQLTTSRVTLFSICMIVSRSAKSKVSIKDLKNRQSVGFSLHAFLTLLSSRFLHASSLTLSSCFFFTRVPSKRRGAQSEHQWREDMGRSRQQGYNHERRMEGRIFFREGVDIEGIGIVIRNEGGDAHEFSRYFS